MMPIIDNLTLNRLLTRVAESKATGLLFSVGAPPVMRLEGKLIALEDEQILTASFLERLVYSVLIQEQKEEFEKKKQISFAATFKKYLRFKVNIYLQRGYISALFNYVPEVHEDLTQLGLPQDLENFISFSRGLILITGIADSGKSTTVASILNTLNNKGPSRHIVTIENVIEHLFSNNRCILEQREVGRDTASIVQGLKFVSQEQVDLVVVFDFADKNIVKAGLDVLESGKILIATLNSYSSIDTLYRIEALFKDQGVDWVRNLLANYLLCIINQRLIPGIGGGRKLAYEFLVNTGIVKSLILNGNFNKISSFLQTNKEYNIISLDKSLANLVKKGEVHLQDALEEAQDTEVFKGYLR